MPRPLSPKPVAAALAVLVAGLGTPALAHPGDHSHMTFAELANHLALALDHKLAIAAVALVLAIAGCSAFLMRWNARARAKAARLRGKSAT